MASAARRKVVILGSGRTARELAAKMARHPETLCSVVGHLVPSDSYTGNSAISQAPRVIPVKTLGIVELLKAQGVGELIVVGSPGSQNEMVALAARCRNEAIQMSLVPDLYELYLAKPNLLDLDGLPVLQLPEPTPLVTSGLKRVMDLALGMMLAAPALPILLFAAILLRMQGKSPFRFEVRCGYNAEHFRMLRLNVTRNGADLTFLEHILEELSITELPQLWNVLSGQMSLVGPRPESADRVDHYTDWERQRLMVKPGMTGLAQVCGLRDQHSSEEKCRFDLQYLLDCSIFLDLSLLLQTIWTLAGRPFRTRHFPTAGTADRAVKESLFVQEIVSAHRAQSGTD
jgi:lipopolysaccharide/colanic/teichoic acid biosynthesis glycosyltransferase